MSWLPATRTVANQIRWIKLVPEEVNPSPFPRWQLTLQVPTLGHWPRSTYLTQLPPPTHWCATPAAAQCQHVSTCRHAHSALAAPVVNATSAPSWSHPRLRPESHKYINKYRINFSMSSLPGFPFYVHVIFDHLHLSYPPRVHDRLHAIVPGLTAGD